LERHVEQPQDLRQVRLQASDELHGRPRLQDLVGEAAASRSLGAPSAVPQPSQKRAPAGRSRAQLGQRLASRAPH